MARIDDAEVEVFCRQCNGYLYSIGPAEVEARPPYLDPALVDCPMQKDPRGRCTGKPRTANVGSGGSDNAAHAQAGEGSNG